MFQSNMGGEDESVKIPSYLHPSPLHLDVVLWELHNLKDIQNARNHYLKLVESESNEHVTVPWERFISMPIKLQPSLFHLLPYMFDWESSSLNDFKARLASYRTCSEGWDECVDILFMASFGLWTQKNKVNQSLVYEIDGLGFIGFYHVTYHLVGLFYNMLPWLDSSINRYL